MSTNDGPWIVSDGKFRVELNGTGEISLGYDGGEIDMNDEDAEALSAALARAVIAHRPQS